MEYYRYIPGRLPLIISMPHTGTYVPAAILDRFTEDAKRLPDTDWHMDRLYAFAEELGAHLLIATHSRYVVDLNRGPDNASLYPGQFTTGLCPTTLFNGAPIYQSGQEPNPSEITERTSTYWQPYHTKLSQLLNELKTEHGSAILFDAHSIRSHVSTLFEGKLPDLNFGTADGKTASPSRIEALLAIAKDSAYTSVHNGRFKGGYITRNYGRLAENIESIQLELCQCNYMSEEYPFAYDSAKASSLQGVLQHILAQLIK